MSLHADIAAVISGERRWAVICADNAEVLPTLPDKSVAHTITDPPYEAEAHTKGRRAFSGHSDVYEKGGVGERPLDFDPISETERAAAGGQIARLTQRWALVFCQIEAAMKWRMALEDAGANYRRACLWIKPGAAPQFTGDRPGMGYETLVAAHAPGRSRWNGGGKHGVFTCPPPPHHNRDHGTAKPLPLMLELVELFTDPDEVVLDPFAGSGTTGVACLRLGRRFIGIEKSPEYAAIARERLEAESRGLTLRDARAGQVPLFSTEDLQPKPPPRLPEPEAMHGAADEFGGSDFDAMGDT